MCEMGSPHCVLAGCRNTNFWPKKLPVEQSLEVMHDQQPKGYFIFVARRARLGQLSKSISVAC